jgi:hypothetical protein
MGQTQSTTFPDTPELNKIADLLYNPNKDSEGYHNRCVFEAYTRGIFAGVDRVEAYKAHAEAHKEKK